MSENKKKVNLNQKYRLTIFNNNTLKEINNFNLTKMNGIVYSDFIFIVV